MKRKSVLMAERFSCAVLGTSVEDHFTEQLLLLLPPGSWAAAAVVAFYTEMKSFACTNTRQSDLNAAGLLANSLSVTLKIFFLSRGTRGSDERDKTKNTAAD